MINTTSILKQGPYLMFTCLSMHIYRNIIKKKKIVNLFLYFSLKSCKLNNIIDEIHKEESTQHCISWSMYITKQDLTEFNCCRDREE